MSSPTLPLIIVALGVSADGPDALRAFFAAMRLDARLPFVVITHLPPHGTSQIATIRGRSTLLRVIQAQHGEQRLPAAGNLPGPGH